MSTKSAFLRSNSVSNVENMRETLLLVKHFVPNLCMLNSSRKIPDELAPGLSKLEHELTEQTAIVSGLELEIGKLSEISSSSTFIQYVLSQNAITIPLLT